MDDIHGLIEPSSQRTGMSVLLEHPVLSADVFVRHYTGKLGGQRGGVAEEAAFFDGGGDERGDHRFPSGVVVLDALQDVARDGRTDVTFTIGKADLEKAQLLAKKILKSVGAEKIDLDRDVAKISVVGVGMRNHAGVAAKMFEVLADEKVNILAISTSEIKVSVLISAKYTELAVRALHTAFGLDAPEPIAAKR